MKIVTLEGKGNQLWVKNTIIFCLEVIRQKSGGDDKIPLRGNSWQEVAGPPP